jgi:IS5 family transposase
MDSFPVAVCKNIRIEQSKLLQQEAYRGYNASKRGYFYGFNVQLITTANGIPVDFDITAGSIHDNTAWQAMPIHLPEGSEVYADGVYLNDEGEDLYQECEQVRLLVERKRHSKRKDTPAMRFLKQYYRKRIETTFSEITAHFPAKIHAVTPQGFLLKINLFIFAFTFPKLLSV